MESCCTDSEFTPFIQITQYSVIINLGLPQKLHSTHSFRISEKFRIFNNKENNKASMFDIFQFWCSDVGTLNRRGTL